MSNGESPANGPQFRTAPLVTSAVLVGAGTLIALAGTGRGRGPRGRRRPGQWIDEMEVPPSEQARQRWAQARTAMAAGAAAWQNGTSR